MHIPPPIDKAFRFCRRKTFHSHSLMSLQMHLQIANQKTNNNSQAYWFHFRSEQMHNHPAYQIRRAADEEHNVIPRLNVAKPFIIIEKPWPQGSNNYASKCPGHSANSGNGTN